LKYFLGLHIKSLITLKIFGATFGIGGGAIASIAPPWPRACARIEFFFPLPHTSTVNPTSRNLRNRAFSNQPKTHATCFIAGRNLSSGSFQSQQDVLKNTAK